MSTKRILTTTAVVAILGLLVYFQVQHWRSFDWARFASASRVDPWHVAAAIALIYVTYVLRALRWKIFLEPVRKTRTAFLLPPTLIGFTGLALLGRPGELIRPYLIARREGLSLTSQIRPACRCDERGSLFDALRARLRYPHFAGRGDEAHVIGACPGRGGRDDFPRWFIDDNRAP